MGMGGSLVKPTGFVLMNVKVPCVQGYDEDQVALVMDDPGMTECPVILGTPTLYRVMEVIKESEISKLAAPWSSSKISWLMQDVMAKHGQVVINDMANKPIAPLDVDKLVRVASKCTVPPFGHKVIHGRVKLVLHGCRLNMMTHGLEKRSPSLPLGIDVQTAYATLANGSHRVPVILRNNTQDWLEIKKGMPITKMVTANAIPKVTHILLAGKPQEQSTLTEAERQEVLLEKLNLTGLEAWPEEQAEKAHSLLKEYHDIFSLEKNDMGHTKATKHKIVLKDPDTPPFKERFHRIPPPQLDEVHTYLKMMLDAGVIQPSNSPWCNAVVLVRKKDGSLCFCINFKRLNILTVKDSHPLPCICETLESLAGVAHYSTIDMNSGFLQVPMDEESKQYTAFKLSSMGLYECVILIGDKQKAVPVENTVLGRVLIHHTTIGAERYLLSLVVIIIDGHPGQAFRLVELVNHVLQFILERHIWGYDGYQWAISLSVEEWAQARYLLGDTGSGVQGQPFIFIFEIIGLALDPRCRSGQSNTHL